MNIKEISKNDFSNFASKNKYATFYQSIEWYHLKQKEGRKCELVGLYDNDKLVGVSLIIYLKVMHKFFMAYAPRGFLYDYSNISDFKESIHEYLKNKKVIFFRMDPPIILNSYDKDLNKKEYQEGNSIIKELINNGFKHYGFNMSFETNQFRFVHTLEVLPNTESQLSQMSKSTKKNIELAKSMGVRIDKVDVDKLDAVYDLFESTIDRKKIIGFSKNFYQDLCNEFKDIQCMYIAYVDKSILINNLNTRLEEVNNKLGELKKKMEHDNVGAKLKHEMEITLASKEKITKELAEAKDMPERQNIGSMLCIFKYNEAVSFVSGMDNKYRRFCPKYAMYPQMIEDARNRNISSINFLGVKNIFDKKDEAYGVYEVKKGFGGNTLEYIGEFDLPINKILYKIYKLNENRKRG